MVNFMRSLLLTEQFYADQESGCETENQLVFTFSDKSKEETRVWCKAESKFPEIFVQGIGLYKSDLLMIRDESFRTHKGYYEINGGYERWVDSRGNEILDVMEWMTASITTSRFTQPTTKLLS